MTTRRSKKRKDPALEAIHAGWARVARHPLFAPMVWQRVDFRRDDLVPADGWALLESNGTILVHRTRRASADEWAWVFAHLLIHLGLGHAAVDQPLDRAASAACDVAVNRFLASLGIGRAVVPVGGELPATDEEALARLWRRTGVPAEFDGLGVAGNRADISLVRWNGWGNPPKWTELFAAGLSDAAAAAVDVAGGARSSLSDRGGAVAEWDLALGWFVSSYPLLGALAATMKVVAEAELARGWDIQVAAVNAEAGRSTSTR